MASDMYGIEVLANGIQDMQGNTTRFLVIGQNFSASTGDDKTSVVFGVKHAVGALHEALSVFKADEINLSKIGRGRRRNKAWEYYFLLMWMVTQKINRWRRRWKSYRGIVR